MSGYTGAPRNESEVKEHDVSSRVKRIALNRSWEK